MISAAPATAIEMDSVAVQIDDVPLLEPVSFVLAAGTATAITGANGAGKTTLLRVLAGLIAPTSGTVRIGGLSTDERNPQFRRMVAGQIGSAPFARDLTLEEQLVMVAVSWGAEMGDARERAVALLEDCGILNLRTRFAHELSSGQTQMFSFALAIARPFDVLLLDEPEQRLDKQRRQQVAAILNGIVAEGKTLVFASHNAKLIGSVSDSSIALKQS